MITIGLIAFMLIASIRQCDTTVLVIGASGRVGSAVVSRLVTQGVDTRVMVRGKKF